MEKVRLGLVGCGGMGTRHLHGMKELYDNDLGDIELVGVCDLIEDNASALADIAHSFLGKRPEVFKSLEEMLEVKGGLDAVDVTTDPRSHHTVACSAFENGLHVLVEKPMGITVKACNLMMDSAAKHNRILSVAENFRRDPMNRLVKSLLENEIVGTPYFMVENRIGGGNKILITPWRHLKDRSGMTLDAGVHNADILSYFMGDVAEVYATSRLYEKVRYKSDETTQISSFYERSNKNMPDSIVATMEDSTFAIIQFTNGAVGHWTISYAGHGKDYSFRGLYGSTGSIFAPNDRSGKRVRLFPSEGEEELSDERILEYVPDFKLDEPTAKLFSAQRLHEYKMPFLEIDRKLIALEIHELAVCIREGASPEVDGVVGRRDVAVIYALFESSLLDRAVKIEEVESGDLCLYQEEINQAVGIGETQP